MSWFTELAGKAENILNKIDQNAANVLQQKEKLYDEVSNATTNSGFVSTRNIATTTTNPINLPIKSDSNLINKTSPKALNLSASYQNKISNIKQITAATTPSKLNRNSGSVSSPSVSSVVPNIECDVTPSIGDGDFSEQSSFDSHADGTVHTVIERKQNLSPSQQYQFRQPEESVNNQNDGVVKQIDTNCSIAPVGILTNGNVHLEQELAATKIILAEIQSERDDLKYEYNNLMEQTTNVDHQLRVNELEDMCNRLLDEKDSLKTQNEALENSNVNYVKSISELETVISKLHQNELELVERLEWTKRESEQAFNELQQYRARAQITLQMKEKLIEQLKEERTSSHSNNNYNINIDNGSGVSEDNIHHNIQSLSSNMELEHIKKENANLNEELKLSVEQLEQTRITIRNLEKQYTDRDLEYEQKFTNLNDTLKQQKRVIVKYENDLGILKQELSTVRDEMQRQRQNFTAKIHEKETELFTIQTKLLQTPIISQSNGMGERIQSLTQSLVQKQNSLETVTAERNAMRLQLEKIENQHRNTMLLLRQQSPQIINVNDTDDAKAQVPNFLQENPFDTRVTRRVKRAYSTLDSVGVRLGVFLRRYPLIRILVIFYVVLLHLWVILVLFSSTPN